jgi:hypothetical protein
MGICSTAPAALAMLLCCCYLPRCSQLACRRLDPDESLPPADLLPWTRCRFRGAPGQGWPSKANASAGRYYGGEVRRRGPGHGAGAQSGGPEGASRRGTAARRGAVWAAAAASLATRERRSDSASKASAEWICCPTPWLDCLLMGQN